MTSGPPDKEPSCINCGGAGHWAIACPEPTRQVPAGVQGQRPADERYRNGGKHGPKRHKGPIVNKYSPPAPAPTHGSHPPPFAPPFAPPYGGYRQTDHSYLPPGPAPSGHFGGSAPPPAPPPSYSPPPHLPGGSPHSAPPHSHHYGPLGSYGAPPRGPPNTAPYGRPPGYPGGPPLPPPPPPFTSQHESSHQYQYYQQHPQGHHPHPPPPPPPPTHYDYSPPPTQAYAQHPYSPPPPPPASSANVGHPFHGHPPHGHPPHGRPPHGHPPHGHPPHGHSPPSGPPYMNHPPPGPPPHHSPTPQSSAPHGHPPSLPSLPNIGGPGSLIRVLPPKPTVQVPPTDRGHGRRKDRNKSWRNKRNKEKHTPTPAKTNGASATRNELKSTSELTKGTDAKRCNEEETAEAHGAAGNTEVGQTKSDIGDVDAASKVSDKPEEGEILDEDSEWEWDEKTIFKEHPEVHLADAVAGPLPVEYTDHVLLPPAWNAKCITSKFVNLDNKSEFCRSVRETPLWDQYKHTVPFGSPRSTRAPLASTELQELLETRRSSLNPGPRREPKVRSHKMSFLRDREGTRCSDDRGRAISRERSISPERHSPQKDRRPVIDSYRPNYGGSRPSRSLSVGRRRRRSDDSPSRGQDARDSPTPLFQLPLEDRSRDSSPESDLNSLENELLGLSPKSSYEEEKKAEEKKIGEPKKRLNDDAIPKSKRRRVQVDSAFGRRW